MPSRIYTRTGDGGTTRLGTGEKIEKQSQRVAAYGTLYELNAFIGQTRTQLAQARPEPTPEPWQELEGFLHDLQHRLFLVGSDLSSPRPAGEGRAKTAEDLTKKLEILADQLRNSTPPWKPFTIPEGALPANSLYIATTICRRAEREIWTLNKIEKVPHGVLTFVNRLSDVLFTAARYVNAALGIHEEFTHQPERY